VEGSENLSFLYLFNFEQRLQVLDIGTSLLAGSSGTVEYTDLKISKKQNKTKQKKKSSFSTLLFFYLPTHFSPFSPFSFFLFFLLLLLFSLLRYFALTTEGNGLQNGDVEGRPRNVLAVACHVHLPLARNIWCVFHVVPIKN
jgi:hypothetical protein